MPYMLVLALVAVIFKSKYGHRVIVELMMQITPQILMLNLTCHIQRYEFQTIVRLKLLVNAHAPS